MGQARIKEAKATKDADVIAVATGLAIAVPDLLKATKSWSMPAPNELQRQWHPSSNNSTT